MQNPDGTHSLITTIFILLSLSIILLHSGREVTVSSTTGVSVGRFNQAVKKTQIMNNQVGTVLLVALPVTILLVLSSAKTNQLMSSDSFAPMETMRNSSDGLNRWKRQFMCPPGCYPGCQSSSQCQQYAPRMVCVQACCCPSSSSNNGPNINIIPIPIVPINPLNQLTLANACDGGPAVAACINGLCGQGYFCNARGFCCRCPAGNSTGPCVNNQCPAGYACNTNDFCCPLGSGSVLGPCINGQCPIGHACGAGNLCYSSAVSGL